MNKLVTSTACIALATAGLHAGETAPAKGVDLTPVPQDSWKFSIAPYLWLAGIDGTVGLPNTPPADVDASFSDIWDNLDFAGFLLMEANKGKFHSFLDFQYIKLGADAEVMDVSGFDIGVEQVRLELGVGYRVYETESTNVIAYAAVMYNYLDNELDPPSGSSIGTSESWVDPAIGIKIRHSLTDHWFLGLTGEYGGFGVSSDDTWQAIGTIGYSFNNGWSVIGGYRHQSIDYEEDGFLYDAETSGPFLGAAYTF